MLSKKKLRKWIANHYLPSSLLKVISISLRLIKNASTSLSKYLDWSLYGILFSGGIRGRRTIHSFPFPESLGDRVMNLNRETYRSIFGMREKKPPLKISSCMVGDPLDKLSDSRVHAV